MNKEKVKTYCSLDIETSGFDPLKDEILEVGFAFFVVSEKGLKITEEWTQVFKPVKPVQAKIFGLTGISQKELDNAPSFSEYKEFIQKKLETAVIVGHNVIFDIKFLQAQGIKFSGEIIDTLDLVQFILPTHHSYNLENLMHLFNVDHKDAHRALADSKAALAVLEKLLGIYSGFPKELKQEILRLISPFALPFAELLKVNLPILQSPLLLANTAKQIASVKPLEISRNTIYNFPLGANLVEILKNNFKNGKQKVLLVLPKEQQVIEHWKKGELEAVFNSEFLFDEKKLELYLKKENLSLDETKFLLKVLVWKHTNWQSECVLDLNLSFFGGQFKSLLCGKKIKEKTKPALLCSDQKTFLHLAKQGLYKNRLVVIVGLNEFEQNVSSNISQKAGWGNLSYLLRSFYNPELGEQSSSYKNIVLETLASSDLFFGLVSALLQTTPPSFMYFKITPEVLYSERYGKIKAAAENFCEKLTVANKSLKSPGLTEFVKNLQSFFEEQENRIKWIELADKRCIFSSTPISIKELVKESLTPFKNLALADSLGLLKAMDYFSSRLGVEDFKVSEVVLENKVKQKKSIIQTLDLFSKLKGQKNRTINCVVRPSVLATEDLLKILQQKNAFPAAVLFGGTAQVRDFYDQHYKQLQEDAFILAQTASGGTNKIFHNFTIRNNSLLLASDKFILKFLTNNSNVQTVEHLKVKTLVISHLPFEQFSHPYQEAVSAQYANPFEEFSLPRALYNFHSILQFFNTEELENIYICDSKLAKGYATAFKDYLKVIPNVVMG